MLVVGEVAASYSDRSLIARLAAALLAVQAWQRRTGVDDPAAAALTARLWEFTTVGGPTFGPWHVAWTADPLRRELSEADPGTSPDAVFRIHQVAVRAGVSPAPLLSGLLHADELVGGNLFRPIDHHRTLDHLHAVETLLGREGVPLVAASNFPDQPVTDFHGWGHPVDAATVTRWRALA